MRTVGGKPEPPLPQRLEHCAAPERCDTTRDRGRHREHHDTARLLVRCQRSPAEELRVRRPAVSCKQIDQ